MSALTATPPPLTASLTNADGSANIYLSTDPSLNRITVKLTNTTDRQLDLPAGQPVPYDTLPAGTSCVYLDFHTLLSNDAIAAIKTSAPWSAGAFTDQDNTLQYLAIAAGTRLALAAGATLELELDGILATGSPTSGYATLTVLGATGIPAGRNTASLYVNIAEPPEPGDLDLTSDILGIGFDDPNVYAGHDAELVLHLTNRKTDAPLVPAATKWEDNPTFRLVLLAGDSVGALTTVNDAAQITGEIANSYGNMWKPVQPDGQGWKMEPQPDARGGGGVLGTDAQATTEFLFSGIVASSPPAGLESAITVAHVSWTGIPGYKAGSRGVEITKHHGPAVSFSAHPPGDKTRPSVFGYQDTTLTTVLEWQAEYADHVTFDVPDPRISNSLLYKLQGSGPLCDGITARRDRPLRITAHKNLSGATATAADTHSISLTASLFLATASRTDVTLPAGGTATFVIPRGSDIGYVFWLDTPRFATVDLRSRTVGSLQDVLPADYRRPDRLPWRLRGIRDVASSPDGSLLYLFAEGPASPGYPARLSVLRFDVTTNSMLPTPDGIVGMLDAPTKHSRYETTMISASRDGKWLAIWSGGEETAGSYLVGAADLRWSGTTLDSGSQWDPDRGPVVAINATGSRLFKISETALTMYNTDLELAKTWGGPSVPVTLDLKNDHGLVPLTPGRLTADGLRIYLPMIDEKSRDRPAGTVTAVLAVVDVSSHAWVTRMKPPPNALSLADTVPLGTMPASSIAGRSIPVWTENWTALSADEKTVYVGVWPDIATVDTTSGAVHRWPVGATSPRLTVQGQTVYCTPLAEETGALPIIDLTPETSAPDLIPRR